jgi:hypothetical protein
MFTAARLKVTTTLDTTQLLALNAPDGKPACQVAYSPGRPHLTAEIAAKSRRKA